MCSGVTQSSTISMIDSCAMPLESVQEVSCRWGPMATFSVPLPLMDCGPLRRPTRRCSQRASKPRRGAICLHSITETIAEGLRLIAFDNVADEENEMYFVGDRWGLEEQNGTGTAQSISSQIIDKSLSIPSRRLSATKTNKQGRKWWAYNLVGKKDIRPTSPKRKHSREDKKI